MLFIKTEIVGTHRRMRPPKITYGYADQFLHQAKLDWGERKFNCKTV